ncbi:MAG: acetyl-CoA C-acyltransferase [Micromonosporaceae bacterium]|nr:acetyl-CoA C-acyltransferase [Micromonosporaceae bacterium]
MAGSGPAEQVVVAGYARTPFGRFGGALRGVRLPVLGAVAVRAAVARSGVEPAAVAELAVGVNFPGSERSVARQVQLRSGIPEDRSAYTVDRACCSSLAAVALASRGLRLGDTAVAVAGGVDNLSRVPYFLETARFGSRLGDLQLTDQLVVACPHSGVPRAVQAAVEAGQYGVDRVEQDEWAVRSQERYQLALAAGRLDAELVPVDAPDAEGGPVLLDRDEVPRPRTTLAALSALPTVNGSTTVTAGNAPDLSSGASALVLTSGAWAREQRVPVRAQLSGFAMASGDPQQIASMPARAARLALRRAGLDLSGVDLLEVNEAFAAVPLVTTLELADRDQHRAEHLRERTNVGGGAIAVGHPTGATAGRLVMTLVSQLTARGGGTGLVTICGGVGEAEAVVVRVG